MRYFLTAICIILYSLGSAQIVNVESRRIQSDTTGWLGNFGVGFKLDKNTVSVLNLSTAAQIEYKAPKSLYLFLVNYDLLRGAAETLQDNLFFHVRYNYKISKTLRWEAFTQMQHNNLAGIQNRWLVGTGPRFKVSGTKKLALYAASLLMYEKEKELTEPITYHRDIRNSSYVSASWKPMENGEIISTVFYQPLLKDFSDYRLLHELKLKFKFSKKFAFFTEWNFMYDSHPPLNIPKNIYSLKNGIDYEF